MERDTQPEKMSTDTAFRILFQKHKNMDTAKKVLVKTGDIEEKEGGYLLYKGPFDIKDPVQALERMGVCTVQIFTTEELKKIQQDFKDTVQNFPEYKRDPSDPTKNYGGKRLVYILDKFAALGNPASFHNPMVRRIRYKAYIVLRKKLFQPLKDRYLDDRKNHLNLETLFDRMMYRYKSMACTPEAWHRDVMPGNAIDWNDEIFGGWINLDLDDQHFSCLPGSHLGVLQSKIPSGFAKLDPKHISEASKSKHIFAVPPGHCVLFPQYILHEVMSKKASHDMMRIFTGWRLTAGTNRLHGDKMEQMMRDQAVMPVPGGMVPPMFCSNHRSYYLRNNFKPITNDPSSSTNLIEWSNESFQDIALYQPKGTDYEIVQRHMYSLRDYGFPLYPKYGEKEKSIYKPMPL